MANREIVNLRKNKQVVAIVVIRAVSDSAVDVVVAPVVVGGMLEGVATLKGQTSRVALLDCGLQGVVMIICIVSKIIDALGPAVQVVKGPTIVLRYASREANYRGLIGPVCWATTGKLVSSLVAYIGKGCREC